MTKINENEKTCRDIADELQAYVDGEMWLCPECDEAFNGNESEEGTSYKTICPNCDAELNTDELDQASVYDYLSDVYDIEYRIDGNMEYRNVSLMVAGGGPNIYIDTGSGKVELYWWSDRASWGISKEVCDQIDYNMEEMYNCRKCS